MRGYLFALVLTAIASSVFAQEEAGSVPAPTSDKKIIYREKSYYDFEDTLINGNLRKPDGSFVFRKSPSQFSNDLKLKRSFIPELKESAQDVR